MLKAKKSSGRGTPHRHLFLPHINGPGILKRRLKNYPSTQKQATSNGIKFQGNQ
jgi:hypothetical protein